jgi:Dolichyl-phosphate-mannose-protein mannosyltransferase/C-terminal four TMM region of protein-O-mannosyltransferase
MAQNYNITPTSDNTPNDKEAISITIWQKLKILTKKTIFIYAIIIFVCGFMTFFQGYSKPDGLFWDENYHIASAQRYLQGKFFMEPHPPLGKLLIALGEKIVNPNEGLDVSKMVGTSEGDALGYIKSMDVKWLDPARTDEAKFNFSGVRLFPVLAAWACALLILAIVYTATRNPHIALLISFAYTFDNSIVAHSRGAMIDSIQLFFVLCSTLMFVKIWTNQLKVNNKTWFVLCSLVSLAFAVKMNSLIILLFLVLLMIRELWFNQHRMIYVKIATLLASSILAFFAQDILKVLSTPKGDLLVPSVDFWSWVIRLFSIAIVFSGLRVLFFPSPEFSRSIFQNMSKFVFNWTSKFGVFILTFFVIVGGAYQVHFGLTGTMLPGNDFVSKIEVKEIVQETSQTPQGTVTTFKEEVNQGKSKEIQDKYYAILETNQTWNPANFVFQMKQQLDFVSKFQKGVPSLDLKKGDDEAGSYPLWWTVGARTISYYRTAWSPIEGKQGSTNHKDYLTEYLSPVPNVLVWWMGLLGILLAFSLFASKFLWNKKIVEVASMTSSENSNPNTFYGKISEISPENIKLSLIACFTLCYMSYMLSMSVIDRVLYIYHYYLALVVALIVFGLVIDYYITVQKITLRRLYYAVPMILIFANFMWMSPFTYATRISVDSFNQRNILRYIGLRVNKNMEPK